MKFNVGQLLEVLKAYCPETKARTGMDEFSCCEFEVVRDDGDYVLGYIKGQGEVWLIRSRLKLTGT